MGTLIAHLVRKLAEGDFDFGKVKLSVVYWKLAGAKTWIGVGFAVVYFAMTELSGAGLCPDCSAWAGYVAAVSAFMVTVGLGDAFIRAQPPYRD